MSYSTRYSVVREWLVQEYVQFGTSVCRIWYSVNCDYVVPYNVVLDTVGVSAYLYFKKFTNQCRNIFFGVKYKYLPFLDAFVFLNIKTNLLCFLKCYAGFFTQCAKLAHFEGGGVVKGSPCWPF